MDNVIISDFDEDPEGMSMIPYDPNRDVVLQHADSVVYFDPRSRQLSLRNKNGHVDSRSIDRGECPTCGRPWPHASPDTTQAPTSTPEDQPSFINRDYFRMLARSLPGSSESSAPPSPRRRTIQPARTRLSTPPNLPPPDVEFVGSAPAPPSPTHGISETAFTPQYFERFFVIEKELGKGGRGVVLLVKHVLDGVTLGHFACKRVPIGDDHAWLEKVLVEVQALQALSHQNLVSYRHVWLEDYQLNNFGPSVPCAFILQQYCNGGDLHNYVCGAAKVQITTQELKDRIRRRSRGESEQPRKPNESKTLSLDEIYAFFKDITAGLRFLHLSGFIHRDLKPSNCLLHTVGGETRVLVSDFGEVQYENAARKSTGATGTISYCAPEVLKRETPAGPFGNFTFKSDIFSLGMILYFLCFANLPYRCANVLHEERENMTELRAEIISWAGFDDQRRLRPELPSQLYGVLKRLLALSPEDRPTADEVSHGIRLGSLENMPDSRRRKSMSPEELTPGRRIQKLDSPASGNSPHRGSSRDLIHATFAPSMLRRRSSRGTPMTDSPKDRSSDIAVEDEEGTGSTGMERSASAPARSSRTGSIVEQSVALIPKPSTALPSPMPSPLGSRRRTQFLLPPPQQTFAQLALARMRGLLFHDLTSRPVRISILAIKILTALQPCLSAGMNMSVLYPLLGFALLEQIIEPLLVWKAGLGLALHTMILSYALATDTMCKGGRAPWQGV